MKKISFVITPAQAAAFEAMRRRSPLGVEPAASVARRFFLIGLMQADIPTNPKSKIKK
jgi:hypothetical protein